MNKQFGDLLTRYFQKAKQTSTQISKASGIPKTTIDTWLASVTRYPRNWQHILKIGHALKLSEAETNLLLDAARHQTIAHYREGAIQDGNVNLLETLSYWPADGEKGSTAPFLAPTRRTDKLFGRDQLIREVCNALHHGEHCVLYGMPGVGKTSMAIEITYQLEQFFPDGVIWVNLTNINPDGGGFSENKLLASMYTILQAYGRDAQDASTIESRSTLLRELLSNKKALLIFDNVPNASALSYLLPSDKSACVALITTRNQKILRGRATSFETSVLDRDYSYNFLKHKLGEQAIRLEEEAPAVQRVIDLIGGLPLALELAAASIDYLTFQEYADDLENETTRLDYLSNWDELHKDIKGTFQLSFNHLSPIAQDVFTHIGLFSNGRFSTPALTATTDYPITTVKRVLAHLGTVSLITSSYHEQSDGAPQSISNDRFQIHDLLRVFASYKLTETTPDKTALQHRLATYYLRFCQQHATPEGFAKIDTEWEHIETTVNWLIEQERHELVQSFTLLLTRYWFGSLGYLDLRAKYKQAQTWLEYICPSPADSKHEQLHADIWFRLGGFHYKQSHNEEAQQCYAQSTHLLVGMGADENHILLKAQLADYQAVIELRVEYDADAARKTLQQSIDQLTSLSSTPAKQQKGHLQITLGMVLEKSDLHLQQAVEVTQQGLANLPTTMTPSRLSGYTSLAIVFSFLNQRDKGWFYVDASIAAAQQLKDIHKTADGYRLKAIYTQQDGNTDRSVSLTLKALQLYEQIGSKQIGSIQHNLGRLCMVQNRYDEGRMALQEALVTARSYQDLILETHILVTFAELEIEVKNYEAARETLQLAASLYQQTNMPILAPYIYINIAFTSLQQGHIDQALVEIDHALPLAQTKQLVEAEGFGRSIKGLILDHLGRFSEAEQEHKTAIDLLREHEPYELAKAEANYAIHKQMRDQHTAV